MPEQRYAVLIGNGQYDVNESKLPPLRCPAQDVAGLAELLVSEVHGPYQVMSLVDAPHDQVLDAIYDVLITQAGKDDLVLLYYSGHGKPDPHGELHLATSNTRIKRLPLTSVPLDAVGRWMQQSKAGKIVLILDCCYSGAVEKLFTRGEVSDQIAQALPKHLAGRGTYVLTASTDVQVAEEKEGDQYGLLTKHIIAGIRHGAADRDDDGVVSMQELLAYVQDKVSEEGSQSPQGFALRIEGGELAIAKTGKAPKDTMRSEVTRAIFSAGGNHPIPSWIIRAALDAVELKPGLAAAAQNASSERLNRLYRLRAQPEAFLAEIYDIAYQARTEDKLDERDRQGKANIAPDNEPVMRENAETQRQARQKDQVEEKRAIDDRAAAEALARDKTEREQAERAKAEAREQAITAKGNEIERTPAAEELRLGKPAQEPVALEQGEQPGAGIASDYPPALDSKSRLAFILLALFIIIVLGFVLIPKSSPPGFALNNRDEHLERGEGLDAKGDHKAAIAEYREAIRLNPEHWTAHYRLGLALEQVGDVDGAISEYRQVLNQFGYYDVSANLRTLLQNKGAVDELCSVSASAVKQWPEDFRSHFDLGWALYSKNDLTGAANEWLEAIRLNPNDAMAHYNLGLVFQRKNEYQAARNQFLAAAKLDPADSRIRAALASLKASKPTY